MSFTHDQLVEIAYDWILKNCSCGVAFKELRSINKEIPDVIGFGSWNHSVVVECKISRSDFFSDKNKSFRKKPEDGMGVQRFYCVPSGLVKKEELPSGWGLIYVNEKGRATTVYRAYRGNIDERNSGLTRNITAEMNVLYSALRRLHLRGVIDLIYEELDKNPPHSEIVNSWEYEGDPLF